jgi:hypothetical protein
LEEDAAAVVAGFSVDATFFSVTGTTPVVFSSPLLWLSAAVSPTESSLTSAGIGRDCETEFWGCAGVLGVAGVTTNSGGD